jgi:hypothetical protein
MKKSPTTKMKSMKLAKLHGHRCPVCNCPAYWDVSRWKHAADESRQCDPRVLVGKHIVLGEN